MLSRKFSNWLIVALLCVLPAAAQTVVRAGTTAVPWASNISCSPGQFVAASPDNLHVFKAVNLTPGTAANTQPTWNIFSGAITIDGSCAWQEQGTLGLPGSGGSQSGPPQTLTNCTAAGTTLNEGVEFSTQLISGVTSLCGTTAAAGSISVVGVCQTGCGNAGAAQIAYSGYQSGIFDNQTTQNHYVVPSPSNPGQFTDIGATVPAATTENVGIVASTNTGPGTIATIFLAPLSLFARGSSGGSGVVNPPGCANGIAYYPGLGAVISSDCFFTTNGSGDFTAHSGTFNDASHAGYINIIQGPAPPAAPANGVQVTVPTGVTGYIFSLPGANGTGCLQGNPITGGVQIALTGLNCGTGSGTEVQVNGVDTLLQTPINFQDSSSVLFTNPSAGVIQAVTTAAPQALNPTAPTLTTNGSAGAVSYSYKVVGCEDGPTCAYHSAATSASTIATGNATLTSSNSINLTLYADTLYGYRCYNIYRTASAGTPSTTGLIASCVGKAFIDTGLAGDSTTAPATNTTVLDANGLTNPLPGCNKIPATPFGIDGAPCSTNALDSEMGPTFGAPGDANDGFWAWVNQNSAVATWTNGMMNLSSATRSGLENLNCMSHAIPSTPYTFVEVVYGNWFSTGTNNNAIYFGVTDGTKFETIGFQNQNSTANVLRALVLDWTNTTTISASKAASSQGVATNPIYLKFSNDGTNLTWYWSPNGITYTQMFQAAKGAFLSTITKYVACVDATTGAFSEDIDYIRRTQ